MNRLYVVEGSPTLTGASADHRLPLRSSAIEGFARAVAAGVGVPVEGGVDHAVGRARSRDLKRAGARPSCWRARRSRRPCTRSRTRSTRRSATVGTTVDLHGAGGGRARSTRTRRFAALVADMKAGQVELLLILGGNPVYTAPADLDFAEALDKVRSRPPRPLRRRDRGRCHWHMPAAHQLESWGDVRAYDGTASIVQPLIAPLYDSSPRTSCSPPSARSRGEGLRHRAGALAGAARRGRLREGAGTGRSTTASSPARRSPPRAGEGRRAATGRQRPGSRGRGRPRARRSGPTRASSTAASPTTAGCRSCPSRSPSSPGTTPRS